MKDPSRLQKMAVPRNLKELLEDLTAIDINNLVRLF